MLDISDDTSIRLNRSLYDPTRINATATEYSFNFSLPATPVNNKVFGFANALPVRNKFSRMFSGQLYSGELLLFDGTLLVNGFDDDEKTYECNLVSIKVKTVDDIFGDSTLYDLEWYLPYDGTPTINSTNAEDNSDVYFPFVAYGVFEKNPFFSDEVANDYTDRLLLDNTTLFYHETFVPSVNYLDTVRRCFEQKGFDLTGDVFQDEVLRKMYLSVSLPTDQIPVYNLANPKIGSVDISVAWSNSGRTSNALADYLEQDLEWPYARLRPPAHGGGSAENPIFHYKTVEFYNAFDREQATVTENIPSYLFDAGEQCIVIPADGAYRFELEVTATLDTSYHSGKITGSTTFWSGQEANTNDYDIVYTQNILETCPIEVQLVRNVVNGDNDIELIKSKNNYIYRQTTLSGMSGETVVTCYPHENCQQQDCPSKPTESGIGWQWGSDRRTGHTANWGYVYNDGDIMGYDPRVSPNFICGFSTYGGANMAVMKNGRSWYRGERNSRNSFYVQNGYSQLTSDGTTQTAYGSNTYNDAPTSSVSINGNTLTGHIYCTVWLNKDDLVTLNVIHRAYDEGLSASTNSNRYKTSLNARVKMNALTPNDYARAREDNLGYLSDSQYDYDLRIGNFLSSGETMSSFVNNFISSFNLDYQQVGNTVTLNRGKVNLSQPRHFIDLDGTSAWIGQSWSKINFPRTMGVKYSVDVGEWGYWTTVPSEHRNDYNWKDFGDSGYTIVQLDPNGTSSNEISNNFSYCWYQPFTLVDYESDGETESGRTALLLPVIGKYESLAEGADYEEAMKDDSLSMKMRAWFRGTSSGKQVKIQNEDEYAELYIPEGSFVDTLMNYKDEAGSLLRRYFNVINDVGLDEVEVECYLTPMQYQQLINGADVKFDDNLYSVSEVSGYDPTGEESATLTLVRK